MNAPFSQPMESHLFFVYLSEYILPGKKLGVSGHFTDQETGLEREETHASFPSSPWAQGGEIPSPPSSAFSVTHTGRQLSCRLTLNLPLPSPAQHPAHAWPPGVRHSQPRQFPMRGKVGCAQAQSLLLLLPLPVPAAWAHSPGPSTGPASRQPPGPQPLGCPHPSCCP